MAPKTQERAFNASLGNVLRGKHPRWSGRMDVERTGMLKESAGLCPDIIVRHPGGVPVAVETEFAPAHTVEDDARERLGKTLERDGSVIEQSIAVRIPERLSAVGQDDLEDAIGDAELEYCVLSSGKDAPRRWPGSGWIAGGVNGLAACIEHAALSENRIAEGMRVLEDGIGQAATVLRDACADAPGTLERIAGTLHQEDGEQTSRMAMAIVANAMTFHTAIAGAHGIETVDEIRGAGRVLPKAGLLDVWHRILTEINYWPIFRIASDILMPIRNGTAQRILDRLAGVASALDALGATSQHDLCGRMFQRLITDRKFLATFYTLPGSAARLAELAVSRLDVDWSDADAVTSLRVADFACGTGALLNAAYAAMMGRHRRAGGDDREIHSRMMERALVGTDIMPAATHLTATVLSGAHPRERFGNTSVMTLPYGEQPMERGHRVALGALDLIGEESMRSLFGTGRERVRGVAGDDGEELDLPHGGFDLVIMNPPFTRPTGHESEKIGVPVPSFAGFSTGEDEQRAMSARLKRFRKPGMAGHGGAGLASNFIDVGHAKLREGGVLALVLPAAFLRGEAWRDARALFDLHYRDIAVVSIATAGATERAFSADTGMAEVLVMGTRASGATNDGSSTYVNLNGRPSTILEAVTVAGEMRKPQSGLSDPIRIGGKHDAGCRIRGTLSHAGCAGIREAGVARAAAGLSLGELRLPRHASPFSVPTTNLEALGDRGLYHMDISGNELTGKDRLPRGPFDVTPLHSQSWETETWPVLWGHDAKRERRMVVEPDSKGTVRPGCEEKAVGVWERTASRLHFNRDFQINSQPLAACVTPEPTIGGRAWPNFMCGDGRWEVPLALWANTTLGIIAFWWLGTRQQAGRVMVTITSLPTLTVIDARRLSPARLDLAGDIFDRFRERELLPANEAWRDGTRQALDRAMLVDLLGLPEETMEPLELLRRQWCAEPSVHGGKRTAPIPS